MRKYELLASSVVLSGGLLLGNPNLNSLGNIVAFTLIIVPVLIMSIRGVKGLE